MSRQKEEVIALDESEAAAVEEAVIEVANLLQDPKNLEMVEQHIYRMKRRKQMVELSLKNAVETQLNGVRSGLLILQTVLGDAKEICGSMHEINSLYGDLSNELKDNLDTIKETRVSHKEHSLLNDYLIQIYEFKDKVIETKRHLVENNLLQAHHNLMELEACRDGIYSEVFRMEESHYEQETVDQFFSGVQEISDEFCSKIKFFTNKVLNTVRTQNTTKLVSILRIVEREEKKDRIAERRKIQDGFETPDRPKNWQKVVTDRVRESICLEFDSFWELDRDEKNWVLRFVTNMKRLVEEDLQTVQDHLQYCFPPSYNILELYCTEYQDNIKTKLVEISDSVKENGGEATSYLVVFDWSTTFNNILKPYSSKNVAVLTPDHTQRLIDNYTAKLDQELRKHSETILRQERNDRYDVCRDPDTKDDRYYETTTPVIFYQMLNQNLDAVANLSELEQVAVIEKLIGKIGWFQEQYTKDLLDFKVTYFDPAQPTEDVKYIEWLIAACNNSLQCTTLNEDFLEALKKRNNKNADHYAKDINLFTEQFQSVMLRDACTYILDLVFSELETLLADLLTPAWTAKNCLKKVMLTIEDWDSDFFVRIEKSGHQKLYEILAERWLLEYLKAIFNTKSLTSIEEFNAMLNTELEEMSLFFVVTMNMGEAYPEEDYEVIRQISEIVSEPLDVLELEMASFVNKFPDISHDQCTALLALRGDMNINEIKDILMRNGIQQQPDHEPSNTSIFTKLRLYMGPVGSRFFQTVAPRVFSTTPVHSVTDTTKLMASRFTGNISNVIRDSPVLNNVYQAWNERSGESPSKDKVVRQLDMSETSPPPRTNPFDELPHNKGPAPKPPGPLKTTPAPKPPAKKTKAPPPPKSNNPGNPFDEDV